jgi:hypothetical protein
MWDSCQWDGEWFCFQPSFLSVLGFWLWLKYIKTHKAHGETYNLLGTSAGGNPKASIGGGGQDCSGVQRNTLQVHGRSLCLSFASKKHFLELIVFFQVRDGICNKYNFHTSRTGDLHCSLSKNMLSIFFCTCFDFGCGYECGDMNTHINMWLF